MKFLLTFCLFLPFLIVSSHKTHQNGSMDYVGFQPVSYSLHPTPTEQSLSPIPRFISNTNSDFNMKRIFNPIQLRQMVKLNSGSPNALKYKHNPDTLRNPNSSPEFSTFENSLNSADNPFLPKEPAESFIEAPTPKKALRNNRKSTVSKTQESGEDDSDSAPNSKKAADVSEKSSPDKNNKASSSGCDCLGGQLCPPCDYSNSDASDKCRCAVGPEMTCPSCNVGKAIRQIHEAAQKEAKTIEQNNEALIKESELQSKLFLQVKKYAQEMGNLEQKARAAAVQLQMYTNKAMAMKRKMLKAQKQAKALALRTVKNAELSDIPRNNAEAPQISIKTNSKDQDKTKYDITIANNEYNVLDDLDLEMVESGKNNSKSKSDKSQNKDE